MDKSFDLNLCRIQELVMSLLIPFMMHCGFSLWLQLQPSWQELEMHLFFPCQGSHLGATSWESGQHGFSVTYQLFFATCHVFFMSGICFMKIWTHFVGAEASKWKLLWQLKGTILWGQGGQKHSVPLSHLQLHQAPQEQEIAVHSRYVLKSRGIP